MIVEQTGMAFPYEWRFLFSRIYLACCYCWPLPTCLYNCTGIVEGGLNAELFNLMSSCSSFFLFPFFPLMENGKGEGEGEGEALSKITGINLLSGVAIGGLSLSCLS